MFGPIVSVAESFAGILQLRGQYRLDELIKNVHVIKIFKTDFERTVTI